MYNTIQTKPAVRATSWFTRGTSAQYQVTDQDGKVWAEGTECDVYGFFNLCSRAIDVEKKRLGVTEREKWWAEKSVDPDCTFSCSF